MNGEARCLKALAAYVQAVREGSLIQETSAEAANACLVDAFEATSAGLEEALRLVLRFPENELPEDFEPEGLVDWAERVEALSPVALERLDAFRSRFLLRGAYTPTWAARLADRIEAIRRRAAERGKPMLSPGASLVDEVANRFRGTAPAPTWRRMAQDVMDENTSGRLVQLAEEAIRQPARLVDRPDFYRGVAWMLALARRPSLLGRLVEASARPRADRKPIAQRVATAGVQALTEIFAVDELVRLATVVRARPIVKAIDAGLTTIARLRGLSRGDLEELALPTFELDRNGRKKRTLADGEVSLRIDGVRVVTGWEKNGRESRAVPGAAKAADPQTWAEIRQEVASMERHLIAQRNRLEGQMLVRRVLDAEAWGARVLNHPLLRSMAGRLVWTVVDGKGWRNVCWAFGKPEGPDGRAAPPEDHAEIWLWHPLESSEEEVARWREWLFSQEIVQPFKQAYRETYRLTAEELGAAYETMRFADVRLRQLRMAVLAASKGWKFRAATWTDGPGWLERPLAEWALRVKWGFDVSRVGEGEWDHGPPPIVRTGVLRFFDEDDLPVRLDAVPDRVLSEVFREIDLFVTVAGIGVDAVPPEDDVLRPEWERQAFGELGPAAITRREVLQRLLSRLRIGPQCRVEGRFLVVQGALGRYEIHLGTGQARMMPSGRHLLLETARAAARGGLFLPFEGDETLAAILSKAALLAQDDRISDPAIRRQIDSGR